jgi:hypothetical protein
MPDDSQPPANGGQPYTGPERRRFERSMLLSDADVRLLVLAEHGHTCRPEDDVEGLFDVLIDNSSRYATAACCGWTMAAS